MGDALARLVLVSTASLAVFLGPAREAGAEEPCAHLTAPPDLPAEWADAVRNLTLALAELPPTECSPVTLSLEAAAGLFRVVAEAQDGRRAVRSVRPPSL